MTLVSISFMNYGQRKAQICNEISFYCVSILHVNSCRVHKIIYIFKVWTKICVLLGSTQNRIPYWITSLSRNYASCYFLLQFIFGFISKLWLCCMHSFYFRNFLNHMKILCCWMNIPLFLINTEIIRRDIIS